MQTNAKLRTALNADLPELLTVGAVAAWLDISDKAVRHMIDRAQIPPEAVMRIGRRLRVRADALKMLAPEKRAPRKGARK